MFDKNKIKQLAYEFLVAIGEDPDREGLIDTPQRVADMYEELLNSNPANLKYTSFASENYGGIVLVKNIDFSSICEHHLLPFIGVAHIAYIPNETVIGISKLARIVEKHAKSLQLQERLTNEIAQDLIEAVQPKGVAIFIEAKHLCMNIRGIKRHDASTVTTIFTGDFNDFRLQEIFMGMIK